MRMGKVNVATDKKVEEWKDYAKSEHFFCEDVVLSLIARIEQDRDIIAELLSACDRLVLKLDEVIPHINSVFALQQFRIGQRYTGPHFGVELERARAAIAKARAEGK
jgi:hypothetical protein